MLSNTVIQNTFKSHNWYSETWSYIVLSQVAECKFMSQFQIFISDRIWKSFMIVILQTVMLCKIKFLVTWHA